MVLLYTHMLILHYNQPHTLITYLYLISCTLVFSVLRSSTRVLITVINRPVQCVLNFSVAWHDLNVLTATNYTSIKNNSQYKLRWDKGNLTHYYNLTRELLSKINIDLFAS